MDCKGRILRPWWPHNSHHRVPNPGPPGWTPGTPCTGRTNKVRYPWGYWIGCAFYFLRDSQSWTDLGLLLAEEDYCNGDRRKTPRFGFFRNFFGDKILINSCLKKKCFNWFIGIVPLIMLSTARKLHGWVLSGFWWFDTHQLNGFLFKIYRKLEFPQIISFLFCKGEPVIISTT